MPRVAIHPEVGTCYQVKDYAIKLAHGAYYSAYSVYRDRISGSRDGSSAIAWYLQPLPDTRPSYSGQSASADRQYSYSQ